jgi:hypothetical protein
LLSYGKFDSDNLSLLYASLWTFVICILLKIYNYFRTNRPLIKSAKIKIFISLLFTYLLIWRIIIDRSAYYLLIVGIIFYLLNNKKAKNYKLKYFLPALFFCVLAVLFGALVYVKPNLLYFAADGELFKYFAICISFAVCFVFLLYFISRARIDAITNIAGAFILSIMFLPLIRDAIGFVGNIFCIDFIVLFLVVLFILTLLWRQRKILMVFFICASLYGVWTIIDAKSNEVLDQDQEIPQTRTVIPNELLNLQMQEPQSIYLFMHDSFPNKELAAELDLNYEGIEKLMQDYDFNVYDVYSLDDNTLATMTSTFDISRRWAVDLSTVSLGDLILQHAPLYRDWLPALTGDNLTYLLLIHNGYKIWGEGNLSVFSSNSKADTVVSMMNKYNSIPQVLLAIMQGYLNTMLLKYNADLPAMITAEFAAKQNDAGRIMAWGHSGPDHSTLHGFGRETELKNWTPKYYKSIRDMRRELELTIKNNPHAIVIIMSDHGPVMLSNAQRLYLGLPDDEINELYFRDTYGAFMAIRWPDKEKAAKYDKEFYITQDLFPIIFAYLFDSDIPLKYRIKDTAVRIRNHKFDKGRFYPNFYKG